MAQQNTTEVLHGVNEFYIAKERLGGKLLALSTRGNHYRVLVWNLDEQSSDPVAVLGGVDEEVSNLRIIRNQDFIYVAGQGTKAVYVWELSNPFGKTDAQMILDTSKQIYGYGLGLSKNGNMYVLATAEKSLLCWDIDEPKQCRIQYLPELEQEELVILNSAMETNTYQMIGRSCEQKLEDQSIWLVAEDEPMTFALERRMPVADTLAESQASNLETGVSASEIRPEGKVMALLAEKNTVLFDVREKQHIYTVSHSSFDSLDLRFADWDGDYYLVEFYLWLGSQTNTVMIGYRIGNDGQLKEKNIYTAKEHQPMQACALLMKEDRREIYYNQHNNPTIYKVGWEEEESEVFYKLEDGMMAISMKVE